MTKKQSESNPMDPTIQDLLDLHRYARSRHHGARLYGGAFAEKDPELTTDRFSSLVQRLEKQFDCYIIQKRAVAGREISGDLNWPEQGFFHLHGGSGHEGAKLVTKDRMTPAGEILGEIASLTAGYVALAETAIARSEETGKRGTEHELEAIRGWLTAERRRLHDLVRAARSPDTIIEQFGEWAGNAAFDPDPRDVRDMTQEAFSSAASVDDPGTENTALTPAEDKQAAATLPSFHAFRKLPKRGTR